MSKDTVIHMVVIEPKKGVSGSEIYKARCAGCGDTSGVLWFVNERSVLDWAESHRREHGQ